VNSLDIGASANLSFSWTPTATSGHTLTATATGPAGETNTANNTLTANSTVRSLSGWYDTAWTNRKAITINHSKVSGSSSLSDFPMLFSVTDINLKTVATGGSTGKSDGTDLFFTSSDGATKLDH